MFQIVGAGTPRDQRGESVTFFLALAGIGLLIYGLVLFIAWGAAAAALAKFGESALYRQAAQSDAVKSGEALVDRAIEAIPIGFAKKLVRGRLGDKVEGLGFSAAMATVKGASRSGAWIAGGGFALFVASFWLGPRLSQAIAN